MTDVEVLCLAIDAGDDTAIAALSDALEEAGDPRAAGMRMAAASRYRPANGKVPYRFGHSLASLVGGRTLWTFTCGAGFRLERPYEVPREVFWSLFFGKRARTFARTYRTCSTAMFALAAALADH